MLIIVGQDRFLLENIERVTVESGELKFNCIICGSLHNLRHHAENHVENIHFRGHFHYNCKYCGMNFDRRNQLHKHVVLCKQTFE